MPAFIPLIPDLLAKLGGGSLVRGTVDRFPRPPAKVTVPLSLTKLRRVSGVDYDITFAIQQLTRQTLRPRW